MYPESSLIDNLTRELKSSQLRYKAAREDLIEARITFNEVNKELI